MRHANMKIIIIRSCLETQSPRTTKNAQALASAGHDVTVLAWDREGKHPKAERRDGYQVLRFRFGAPYGPLVLLYLPLWWAYEFWWLLRARWDVVHAIDFDTVLPALILARIKKRPIIYEIADVIEDIRPLPTALRSFFVKIDKTLMRWVDAMIICDEARVEEFDGIPNDNTVVVYNSPPDMLQQLNHPPQRENIFTIFYAGAMHKKGTRVANLVNAFQAIKGIDDTRLVIAGFGDLVEEIEKWVSEEPDKVQFLGHLSYSEVLARTTAADLLIAFYPASSLNTRYTTANKIFEAMMSGKPVLVTKGTAMADMVEKERCGLVVDTDSVEEITRAIVRLKEDPELWRRLGANGRRAYEQRYSWTIMKERLITLYQKLSEVKS